MNKTFKILSIDGGGIRGIYPAHILKRIEQDLISKLSLCDFFDMITGTSTGSIIATGIAVNISASDIVDLYTKHGNKIFKKKSQFCFLKGWWKSMYDNSYLSNLLEEIFKDKKLGSITKPLLLPSTDIINGGVHVFKSNYSETFVRDRNVLIKDAILASCAAPAYFNPHKIENYLLADGGLWANNPALAAVIDAQKRLHINSENIKILTLGTGHSKKSYKSQTKNWGLFTGWRGTNFIDFILSLQSQSIMNYLNLNLESKQILRIDFESDGSLPLDDTSCLGELISKADRDYTHHADKIRQFIHN